MIFNKLLLSTDEVINKILESAERKEQLLLTYLNQHCFNLYHRNNEYQILLDEKFSVYQADSGIYLVLRLFLGKKIKRINGTYLNQIILERFIKESESLAIIGGIFNKEFIRDESDRRGIHLVKYINGYFDKYEINKYIDELKNCDARVFFIGMGVPKQEIFAEKLSRELNSKIIICVGNFLEFYFGTKRKAPKFIQHIGLEWFYRLITEPRRLWKRYILGIPYFIYLIFKYKFFLGENCPKI